MIFDSQKSQPQPCKKHTYRPEITPGTHSYQKLYTTSILTC